MICRSAYTKVVTNNQWRALLWQVLQTKQQYRRQREHWIVLNTRLRSEIGVPLSDGYNGDLTSRQNGSVGGYMVKKMIEAQERKMAGK